MTILPSNFPDELIALRRWVIWRYIQRQAKAKPDKVPHTTMGYRADVTNPVTWSPFECALKAAERPDFADGIGFVFSSDDPYCGIDLDNIWQSDADEGAPWALGLLERFADTYTEVSPSGRGVKIWCRARASRSGRWPIGAGAIEIYSEKRFFTVTGHSGGVTVVADHQTDIDALVTNLDGGRPHQGHSAIPDVIPEGQRHNTLVSLAGTMWRRGMTPEAIEAALLVTDQKQCDPPHGPGHIHRIVTSIQRWPR